MDERQEEALQRLYTEFEEREFTPEQASLLCNISLEMLQELLEENLLRQEKKGYRILSPYE